jgi:uncharacterized surface protein with fasciclin (FAS1) repeats
MILSSQNIDAENPSDRPFHEELFKYFTPPNEYFESLNGFEDAFDDELLPSLTTDTIALSADIEDRVESTSEHVAHNYHEEGPHAEYLESFGDLEYDDNDDEEDATSTSSLEGSIFGQAFDLPRWPTRFPKPKLPTRPKRPLPPKRPHRPHLPHRPHRSNPHFKHVNDTIYEFLANSTHHKILYKLVKDDSSLIDLFSAPGKDGKITLFAPIDRAFQKIIDHLPKNHTRPPKWLLKKVIEYHTIDSFYPAGRVLAHRTIPTLFKTHFGPNLTQKIRIGKGLKGISINFYAHPVFFDIFTSNGVVHAIDNILLPPPPTYFILQIFPTAFSTFFQAFHQSRVAMKFFPWRKSPSSWTLFVPANIAWAKIPLGINAFLFSPKGRRILTKLVEYHISPNHTFYTDSIWKSHHCPHHPVDPSSEEYVDAQTFPHKPHWKKHHFNTTLPTLLSENATLRIDEFKIGPVVKIQINGRPGGIIANDVLGFDGVIQVVDRIILPPRRKCHHRGHKHSEKEEWVEGFAEDDEWTIDNLKKIFDEE